MRRDASTRRRRGGDEAENPLYLSFGDMMSGLLMIFVLIVLASVSSLQERERELREREEEIAQLREQIDEQMEARRIVIGQLIGELRAANVDVEVNEETGDVSLAESLLFAYNSAELSEAGRANLERLMPIYARVLNGNENVAAQVSRFIIEGHTSSMGSEWRNMTLSQARAYAVYAFAFSELDSYPHRSALNSKTALLGRGELEADQDVDRPGDRRVTFRIQFTNDQFLHLLEEYGQVDRIPAAGAAR